jgi:hypothetical protein
LMGDGLIGGLLVRMMLLTGCWVMLEIRENMGQCKSEHWDFKSYANTVFRRGCCCVSAGMSTETLKGTWDSANLRAKTLREIS